MEQAKKLQETQAELSQKTFEVTDPSQKVKVVANGAGELISLTLDPTILAANDSEFLAELILQTCNRALATAKAEMAQNLAANFQLPGLG